MMTTTTTKWQWRSKCLGDTMFMEWVPSRTRQVFEQWYYDTFEDIDICECAWCDRYRSYTNMIQISEDENICMNCATNSDGSVVPNVCIECYGDGCMCCGKGRTDDDIYLKIAVSNGEQTETFYRHINKYRDEQEWSDYISDDEYDYELWCDLQLDYDGKDMDGDIEEINQWHYGNGVYKVTDVEYPGIKVEIIGIC